MRWEFLNEKALTIQYINAGLGQKINKRENSTVSKDCQLIIWLILFLFSKPSYASVHCLRGPK
jgi:hypothetical protein